MESTLCDLVLLCIFNKIRGIPLLIYYICAAESFENIQGWILVPLSDVVRDN